MIESIIKRGTWNLRNGIHVLTVKYECEELVGYNILGIAVYRSKSCVREFYGVSKVECRVNAKNSLKSLLDMREAYKSRRRSAWKGDMGKC